MTKEIIRHLKNEDIPALVALEDKCFKAYYRNHRFGEADFAAYLQRNQSMLLVAVIHPSLIGYVAGSYKTRQDQAYAEIESIAVLPSFQRKGVGGKLLKRFIQEAKKWKCSSLSLHVAAANTESISFYTRHGFNKIRRVPAYYDKTCDAVLMKTAL